MGVDEYPFQVLYAEGVRSEINDSRIIRFDYLKDSDKLTVKNGHLILVHHSGKFAEFDGNTNVNVDSLNSEYQKFITPVIDRREDRPDLGMLVDWFRGVSTYCNMDYLDLVGSYVMYQSEPQICLQWFADTRFGLDFTVEARNIYDQVVFTERVEGESISIDLSDKMEMLEEDLVIIKVINSTNEELTSKVIGIHFNDKGYSPKYCMGISALNSLEAACYEIWNGNRHASRFFEDAASLSDKLFYKEMLRPGHFSQ